jgi:DHA2 family multidrug resistance protein
MTPNTPKAAFFWPLILRGVAMGMLFIPITTLSLSTLKGRQIGEGAAFTGMMRQLGGSFGVAIISTFMSRKLMVHRNDLVSKLDVTNPGLQNTIHTMQQSFVAKGQPPEAALKALDYSVMKQAAVLAYMDAFIYIGLLFLVCIPFVLFVRGRSSKQVKMEMH